MINRDIIRYFFYRQRRLFLQTKKTVPSLSSHADAETSLALVTECITVCASASPLVGDIRCCTFPSTPAQVAACITTCIVALPSTRDVSRSATPSASADNDGESPPASLLPTSFGSCRSYWPTSTPAEWTGGSSSPFPLSHSSRVLVVVERLSEWPDVGYMACRVFSCT